MCSVNEIEQAGDSIKSKKSSKRRDKGNSKNFAGEGSCMKCPEKAVVLVRNNDPFCRTCFLDYIMHKFRATIGKARVIHQGQRVLLAVSGGSASMAMLDLVIKGKFLFSKLCSLNLAVILCKTDLNQCIKLQ